MLALLASRRADERDDVARAPAEPVDQENTGESAKQANEVTDEAVLQRLRQRQVIDRAIDRRQPARQAQALGHIMVVPSRAESLPYVVLEAAASSKPLIASRVGGIPEIYGPLANLLVPSGDPVALAGAIAKWLDDPAAAADTGQQIRSRVVKLFSLGTMVDGVLAGYQSALARPRSGRH